MGDVCHIQRLPTELYIEVFCFIAQDMKRKLAGRHVRVAPWQLGHVCHTWRTIAHGYPQLWSCITIDYSTQAVICPVASPIRMPGRVDIEYPLTWLQTQLTLSGDVPLVVRFRLDHAKLEDSHHLIALFDLCVVHSRRWEHLTIAVENSLGFSIFHGIARVRGLLDRLQSLHITGHSEWEPELNNVFSNTPCLRNAALPSPRIAISWQQLTRLEIHANVEELLGIASCVRENLEELVYGNTSNVFTHSHPVATLPRLRQLSLTLHDDVLQYLLAPCLEELALDAYVNHVAGFVYRSGCNVQSLSFACLCPPIEMIDVSAIFRSVGGLRSLRISIRIEDTEDEDAEIDDEDHYDQQVEILVENLRALTLTSTSKDLCPCQGNSLFWHYTATYDAGLLQISHFPVKSPKPYVIVE
ncbi:hypothetical protein R3P38DRAFT_3035712 [Favolaschia claudopus]|uniref:F-box domain-containing protein n=1 Tax=Favolaschia claudopus TaxID=2862362 RepID=A0AAW0AEW8_9AGAR